MLKISFISRLFKNLLWSIDLAKRDEVDVSNGADHKDKMGKKSSLSKN